MSGNGPVKFSCYIVLRFPFRINVRVQAKKKSMYIDKSKNVGACILTYVV